MESIISISASTSSSSSDNSRKRKEPDSPFSVVAATVETKRAKERDSPLILAFQASPLALYVPPPLMDVIASYLRPVPIEGNWIGDLGELNGPLCFDSPFHMSSDPSTGLLYIADASRVVVLDTLTDQATYVRQIGRARMTGADGEFVDLHGVCVHPVRGEVFCADSQRIHVFRSSDGTLLRSFAFDRYRTGRLSPMTNIVIGPAPDYLIYVVLKTVLEKQNSVRYEWEVLSPVDGSIILTVTMESRLGIRNTSNGGVCIVDDGGHQFMVVTYPSYLYNQQPCVKIYTFSGTCIQSITDCGPTEAKQKLVRPMNVVYWCGELYVNDWGRERIFVYDIRDGRYVRTITNVVPNKGAMMHIIPSQNRLILASVNHTKCELVE